MAKYHEEITETIREDENGNTTKDTVRKTKAITKNEEPDYIKLYTKLWFDAQNIPEKYLKLFIALVCRMSYANPNSLAGGQIVYTIGHTGLAIMKECGWKTKDAFYKGLQTLCDCNAIKKLGRGEYQINPEYAGKGPWRYNPKFDQGGIENIIATFNLKDKKVDTQIIWADDGKNTENNEFYRKMLNANAEDNTTLLETKTEQLEPPEFINELEEQPKQKKTRKKNKTA